MRLILKSSRDHGSWRSSTGPLVICSKMNRLKDKTPERESEACGGLFRGEGLSASFETCEFRRLAREGKLFCRKRPVSGAIEALPCVLRVMAAT